MFADSSILSLKFTLSFSMGHRTGPHFPAFFAVGVTMQLSFDKWKEVGGCVWHSTPVPNASHVPSSIPFILSQSWNGDNHSDFGCQAGRPSISLVPEWSGKCTFTIDKTPLGLFCGRQIKLYSIWTSTTLGLCVLAITTTSLYIMSLKESQILNINLAFYWTHLGKWTYRLKDMNEHDILCKL